MDGYRPSPKKMIDPDFALGDEFQIDKESCPKYPVIGDKFDFKKALSSDTFEYDHYVKCGAAGFSTLLLVEIRSNVKFFPDGAFECFQRNHTFFLDWWEKFDNIHQMRQGIQNLPRIILPRKHAEMFVLTFVDFLCFKLCCGVRFNPYVAISERDGQRELIKRSHFELRQLQANYGGMFEVALSITKPQTVEPAVSSATPKDIIVRFIGEYFLCDQDSTVEFGAVWDMFQDFIAQNELPDVSKKALGTYMKRNFIWVKKGVIYYKGLRVKDQETKDA